MKDQFILKEMQLLKTSLQLIEAKLALMNQCLAFVLYMKLLVAAYFYERRQLKKSKIKSVLDSFMLARLNEPLNIFHQYTAFCYSSS